MNQFQPSHTINTFTGRTIDLKAPKPEDFEILDIAWALSNICRFTGHTHQFFSVAQHSIGVSWRVPQEFALEGLLHDASEAYLCDLSSPLKALLPEYKKIEQRFEHAIANRFDLDTGAIAKKHIKAADRQSLEVEKMGLFQPFGCMPVLKTERAALFFLHRFQQLMRERIQAGAAL
jgi:uncharacterized protein